MFTLVSYPIFSKIYEVLTAVESREGNVTLFFIPFIWRIGLQFTMGRKI